MEEIPKSETGSKANLYVIFAAILVVSFLGVLYFHFFAPSPAPAEFFSAYQYQDTAAKKTMQTMIYDYGAISRAIGAKDNAGAADAVKKDLVQSLKNQDVMSDVMKKSTEMKLMLGQVSDSALREKITSLLGQLDSRNTRMQAVVTSQTDTFKVLRDHFGAIAVGVKGPDIPQNIDKVIQSSQSEIQSIMQSQTTIDFAYDEIVKLAGVDTTVSQTVDNIRMNLSATPEQEPAITDFPTPLPTATMAPTVAPAASTSASATASSSAQ